MCGSGSGGGALETQRVLLYKNENLSSEPIKKPDPFNRSVNSVINVLLEGRWKIEMKKTQKLAAS